MSVDSRILREALARLRLNTGEAVFLTETPQGHVLTSCAPVLDVRIESAMAALFHVSVRNDCHER